VTRLAKNTRNEIQEAIPRSNKCCGMHFAIPSGLDKVHLAHYTTE
jgi:hypothetical protein